MRTEVPSGSRSRGATRPLVVVSWALAALALSIAVPATAFAEGGSVVYSYEQIEFGDRTDYGLVPDAELDLKGKVTKTTLNRAFAMLKKDKSTVYGKSSIRVSGRVPDRAKVVVKIDPKSAAKQWHLIIMAETVYTLTELGVDEVQFPGYYDGGMSREEVPFVAYTLTVPVFKALPAGELSRAQVRLPDGKLIPVDEFYTRWKRDDAELQKALYSYLQDSSPWTVTRVLMLLPKLDLEYAPQVTPLLDHDSKWVRKTALSTLSDKRNDTAVLDAVVKMMESDKDAGLARAAAEFLGKAKSDKYNVYESLYLLDKGEKEEAVAAAKALASRKDDERAVDALYEHLRDKRSEVAVAAAESLEKMDADAKQIAALEDKKIADEVRLRIARTLAEDKSAESKLVGLTYVARNTKGRSAELALRKLGELGSTEARETVEEFLSAETRRKRITAAETLVEMGDAESLTALAKAIKKAKNPRTLEELAYDLMVAQQLSTVLEKTEARNNIVERLAYRALGERAKKEGAGQKVFDKLAQGAKSRDAAIRGASARALGVFANDEALAILKGMADDKSPEVRAGVAYGLANFKGGEQFETLAKYLDDSSPQVQAAALYAMEQRKEATKWSRIKELTESKDPQVRANALQALAQLVSRGDKQGMREVISLLSGSVSDDSRIVQLTALEQLGTFKEKKATTGIAIQLNAQDPNLRVAAIEALGETGHPSATELVLSVLEDPNPDIRRAAIDALGELGAKSAEPQLKALLETEEDVELKKLIKRTLRKI